MKITKSANKIEKLLTEELINMQTQGNNYSVECVLRSKSKLICDM